jgi:hypothetical protein
MAQPSLQDHIGIASALSAIKPDSHEEVVQMLWQLIVIEWFPSRQGYKYGFKAPLLTGNNAPDVIVIQIMERVPNPRASGDFTERQIMLVECKKPSADTPAGWENTVNGQVFDDLSASGNPSNRLFGAVAIGTKVRFYRFDGNASTRQQQLVQMHGGTIDIATTAGVTQVESWMNHVKQQGWQWSG